MVVEPQMDWVVVLMRCPVFAMHHVLYQIGVEVLSNFPNLW